MSVVSRLGLLRMRPRDPEEHRAASPLELFFDLVFVVAVSFSSTTLHEMEVDGRAGLGILGYLMLFFAIWWAWMNFTWFATSFATDDWLYRVMTVVQMGGVLVLAAGAQPAMEANDYTLVTIGYVIMRLALVAQWLRAAASDPELRPTALRYAVGVTLMQTLWVIRLFLPAEIGFVAYFVFVVGEIAVPVWADSRHPTPWNAGHIAERFGLFTLILLGESILASAYAIVDALRAGEHIGDLLVIAACGLVIAAAMWWVYFARDHDGLIHGMRSALTFGYFHYVVFAAAGAFSAGIEVAVDLVDDDPDLTHTAGAAMLSVPVALFLVAVWWLTLRRTLTPGRTAVFLAGPVVIVAAVVLPSVWPVLLCAAGAALSVVAVQTTDAAVQRT